MTKKIGLFCWHASAWSIRIALSALLLCAVASALFVWRVNSAPLNMGIVKDTVEWALRDRKSGTYAKTDNIVLYWPDLQGPLYFELENAQFFNKDGQSLISVGSAALSFSRFGLLTGRIMPKAIILKQPTLRLTRHEDGGLDLGLGKTQSKAPRKERQVITTQIFEYIARPGAQSVRDSLISRLELLRIEDARLLIDDKMAQQSWSFPDFNARLESTHNGMEADISVPLPDVGLAQSELSLKALYEWESKSVSVNLDVNHVALQNLGEKIPALKILSDQDIVVNAHAEMLLGEDFLPTDLRLNIESPEGKIFHEELSAEAIPYQDLGFNINYNHISKALRIENSALSLKGVRFNIDSSLAISDAAITGPMKAWIDPTSHENLLPLWPKLLEGSSVERWVKHKISGGNVDALSAEFNVSAQEKASDENEERDAKWSYDIDNVIAKFSVSGADIDYRAPMMKAENVSGSGILDIDKDDMRISITKGQIGAMTLKKADLYFDYLIETGKGDADLSLDFEKAPIAEVLRFIAKKPLDLAKNVPFRDHEVRGLVDMNVHVNFPAHSNVKAEEVKVGVEATINDLLLPDVVESLDLSGGPYNFTIKDNLAKLSGNGLLEGRNITVAYERFLESEGKPYKQKVKAQLTADPELRDVLGVDLNDFISGSVPVDVDYTSFRNGEAVVKVNADLTPALFFVSPFGYEKLPSEIAQASLTAYLEDGHLKKIAELNATGDQLLIVDGVIDFSQANGEVSLSSGFFPSFNLDQTQGSLRFQYDQNRVVDLSLKASRLDIRALLEPGNIRGQEASGEGTVRVSQYNAPAMRISLNASELITAPQETLRDMIAYIDIDEQGRFNRFEADSAVGDGRLDLRFKQNEEGTRIFVLHATDGGALLKAFNVNNNVVGGEIFIRGAAAHGVFDRSIAGKAELTNFKVVDAPILAKLLGTLSLSGVGDVLRNEGLEFTKMESDFTWNYREGGSLLEIKDGRTSGNSLGLLFSGVLDNAKHEIDVSGTIVPMSGLNRVIGKIPLVGNILTGGSGVFAATYKVKGKSDNPNISVNPLSVITPGILRKLIFE